MSKNRIFWNDWCYRCKLKGHVAKDCRVKLKDSKEGGKLNGNGKTEMEGSGTKVIRKCIQLAKMCDGHRKGGIEDGPR